VFSPSSREAVQPALLTARLALSRLALPQHMRLVLVADAQMVHSLSQNFDDVVLDDDSDGLASVLSRDERTIQEIPRATLSAVRERFAALMDADSEYPRRYAGSGSPTEPSTTPTDADRLQLRLPHSVERTPQGLLLHVESAPSRIARASRLQRAITYGVLNDFLIDNGVPYPRMDQLPINRIDGDISELHIRFDRGKPIRAAAFAGWLSPSLRGVVVNS
jgi:hypothetical protein